MRNSYVYALIGFAGGLTKRGKPIKGLFKGEEADVEAGAAAWNYC